MYHIPWPLFCPCFTNFHPSKAAHDPCTTFLGHFFYSVHPLQPSRQRKSIMTHVKRFWAIFFSTLPILDNLASIESPSQPLYNVPQPLFLLCSYRHTLQIIFLSSLEGQLLPVYHHFCLNWFHPMRLFILHFSIEFAVEHSSLFKVQGPTLIHRR